jgi:ArsR family transcriptional regulator
MHDDQSITVLKALADRTRLDIVRTLIKESDEPCVSCEKVSACSSLSQPAMSHHFKKLVDAGVVLESKHGTEKFYELNHPLLSRLGIDTAKL